MPVYDMAPYVIRSLDAVLAQPGVDVDVVVVDDGSTDGSGDLVEAYAAEHPEVTLIRQENAGVSSARNAAVQHCRGDFLTFVDPDDFLPRGAWAPLLACLKGSCSEFAVGMMERVHEDGRRTRPPLLARNHAETRLGVSIDEMPLMIADVFPCNKMIRMSFWRDAGLTFPVGLSYEDQVFAADLFLAASSFDVLPDVVYDWYVRGDLSSATRSRGRLDNLDDRILTKQMALDRVIAHGNPALVDTLRRQVLPIDMWEHFRAAVAPTTEQPDAYWQRLRDGLRQLWSDDTVPFEHTDLPPGQRLMGWLVAQDRRDDLAALVAAIDGPGVPVEHGRYLHPWRDEPGVPDVLGEVSPGR